MDRVKAQQFARLQARLGEASLANRPGNDIDHLVIVLPSHSVAESLLAHYGPRVSALEHRYLVAHLLLHRLPRCDMVFLCSQAPEPEVLEYYDALGTAAGHPSAAGRFRTIVVDDGTFRPLSAKLLDRPDVLDQLSRLSAGRPALLQPWNVTDLEVEVALRLDVPLNGTSPDLWHLGYKSAGRTMMAAVGVPVPLGRENVRSTAEVVEALEEIQQVQRDALGAVVKLDDSAAGDGNVVIGLRGAAGARATREELHDRVRALPGWYLTELANGGVVEELVTGPVFRSPSVQVHIDPFGEVSVLSTHEQVLGGDGGQVFLGCQFPARPTPSPPCGICFPAPTTPRRDDGSWPTAPAAATARPTTWWTCRGSDSPRRR